jgi:hypothetical protein
VYGYGLLVAIDGASGDLVLADKSLISGALGCLGVYELSTDGTPCIRSSGVPLVDMSGLWSFTPGGVVYVGSAGLPTQTAPSASGEAQQVIGYAVSPSEFFVQPGIIVLNDG